MTHPDTLAIPRAVVEHALQHAKVASQLLLDAHAARPDTWLGFYDDALNHADIAIKDLEALRAALQPQAAEPTICQYCTKQLPNGCSTEFQGEDGCEGYPCKAAAEPVEWVHDCDALCVNNLRLWIDSCPHCGKPRATPPAMKAALTAALGGLRNIVRGVQADPQYRITLAEVAALGKAAIAQIEALGVK